MVADNVRSYNYRFFQLSGRIPFAANFFCLVPRFAKNQPRFANIQSCKNETKSMMLSFLLQVLEEIEGMEDKEGSFEPKGRG